MNIGFYIDEMNVRGVTNSTYLYAINNKKILKNRSIIFYNKKNFRNKSEVIKKFKKKFILIGVKSFKEIDSYKDKYNLEFLYTQKGGNKDNWISANIKTLVHAVYPQKLSHVHGYNYVFISEWLSKKFSNKKIPFIPYITESEKISSNLRKNFKIKKNDLVFGCHGGDSSFDMKFAQIAITNIVKKRKDIFFLFLNINKFCNHPRIIFIKGTTNESLKKKFVNTCDVMMYGRSLGESFGMACAEFAIKNRDIFSYKFNKHRSHKYNMPKKNYFEYSSYSTLFNLLNYYRKRKNHKINSKYAAYTKKKVMKNFQDLFLSKKNDTSFSFYDYFTNYLNHIQMYYFYLRHKIYNHYFNYIFSKFFIK